MAMWLCYSCTNEISKCCEDLLCRYELPLEVHHCEKYDPGEAMQRSMKDFEIRHGISYEDQLKNLRDLSKGRWW
jgi:hypothetical protein